VLRSEEPRLVLPGSAAGPDGLIANPTEHLLLLCPVVVDSSPAPIGVLEVAQRGGASPAAQQGYLRLLAALCDLAAEIHALPKDERASLFRQDGIHFSAAGSRRAARMLFRCLERDGALALVPANAPAPRASTPVRAR